MKILPSVVRFFIVLWWCYENKVMRVIYMYVLCIMNFWNFKIFEVTLDFFQYLNEFLCKYTMYGGLSTGVF